jgi:hypothetical protein
MLEKHMRNAYSPVLYWTSCLRSKAGVSAYENTEVSQSAFTIDDKSGIFTDLLIQNGYKPASWWRSHPTYYIEVNTSEAGLLSKFYLDPHQIKKVCFNLHLIIFLPLLNLCLSENGGQY